MFIGIYNPPALVTMAGLICAVAACWLGMSGEPEYAVVALIWAGVFDLFDGMVARRCELNAQEAEFGIQIDSIVDMLSFGIAPVIVAISLGMEGIWGILASMLYVSAAAQRLAYFNVLQSAANGRLTTYTGLPVTFSALIFGILFSFKSVLGEASYSLFLAALFAFVGFLFVYPIKIPKPKGFVYILMPVLAVVFTVYWVTLALSE